VHNCILSSNDDDGDDALFRQYIQVLKENKNKC